MPCLHFMIAADILSPFLSVGQIGDARETFFSMRIALAEASAPVRNFRCTKVKALHLESREATLVSFGALRWWENTAQCEHDSCSNWHTFFFLAQLGKMDDVDDMITFRYSHIQFFPCWHSIFWFVSFMWCFSTQRNFIELHEEYLGRSLWLHCAIFGKQYRQRWQTIKQSTWCSGMTLLLMSHSIRSGNNRTMAM